MEIELETYKLTLSEGISVVSPSGLNLQKVTENTEVTVKVTIPAGKQVDEFKVNGEVKALTENNEYIFTMVEDTEITVSFSDSSIPIETYVLTLSDGVSVVTPAGLNLAKVPEVTEVTVKVIIPDGQEVDGFKVNNVEVELDADNKYSFTMVEDTDIVVIFRSRFYTLTLPEKVTATPSENYTYNMAVTLKVNVDLTLEEIVEFKVNDEIIDLDLTTLEYTFNIVQDTVVSLTTQPKMYAVRFLNYDGSVLKEENVEAGQDATAPAEPELYKHNFLGWIGDYTNVTEDLDIKAKLAIDQSCLGVNDTNQIGLKNFMKTDKKLKVLILQNENATGIGDPTISPYFISGSYIEKIYIPSKIKYTDGLGQGLGENNKLNEIVVDSENQELKSVDGILYSYDMTKLIAYPSYKLGESYEIPSSVQTILSYAFSHNQYIKDLTISYNVWSIGNRAFEYASFVSLSGCKHISNLKDVLKENKKLEAVNVDPSNGYYASIDGVLYSKNHETLYLYPQSKPGTEFVMHDNTKKIEYLVNDNLKKITFSANVETYQEIRGFSLAEIVVPDANAKYKAVNGMLYLKTLNTLAFLPYAKEITELTLTSCGEGSAIAYGNKYLERVILADSVNDVITGFKECINLKEIVVSATNIGLASLNGVLYSKDMKTIYCYPSGKQAEAFAFPAELEMFYDDFETKNPFVKDIIINDKISDFSYFGDFSNLERVIALEGNTLYSSMDGVLYNKAKTELLYYPPAKKDIKFTIPNGVATLSWAFRNNSYLEEIVFPASLTEIKGGAIASMPNLRKIIIPETVITIGYDAFAYCDNLELYIRASEKPAGWNNEFYYSIKEVIWGYTGE